MIYGEGLLQYPFTGFIYFCCSVIFIEKEILRGDMLKFFEIVHGAMLITAALYLHFLLKDFVISKILLGMSLALLMAASSKKNFLHLEEKIKIEDSQETSTISSVRVLLAILFCSAIAYATGWKNIAILLMIIMGIYGVFLITNKKALDEANGTIEGELS
jgi:uncharacterized membrane protein